MEVIRKLKAFGDWTNDHEVYLLAAIPMAFVMFAIVCQTLIALGVCIEDICCKGRVVTSMDYLKEE